MPIPMPMKDEEKGAFMARMMKDEGMMKEYPDKDQRLAIASGQWKKMHPEDKEKGKESSMIVAPPLKVKESDETEGVYRVIAADTLPDRARGTAKDGTPVDGEILSKRVLDRIASCINDPSTMGGKYGSYRTVSLFHDRVYLQDPTLEEAGFVIPGSAEVREKKDSPGNYELVTNVEVNKFYSSKSNPDYTPEKIRYKLEKGMIGVSIEYDNRADQERIVQVDGKKYTYVIDTDDFRGLGFARPNVIGNPRAVRIKEIDLSREFDTTKGRGNTMEDAKLKELQDQIVADSAKIKELAEKVAAAESAGTKADAAKLKEQLAAVEEKLKEAQLKSDETATKLKESLERAFSNLKFTAPGKTDGEGKNAKVKEIYAAIDARDYSKFKEQSIQHLEENEKFLGKLKEMCSADGPGFSFERWQTVQVKCKGSGLEIVPSPKTKDVIDASDMNEAVLYQTNAMFADRYAVQISETFLKDDSLLKVLPKVQHLGGNDKVQWKLWITGETVSGDSSLAVNPNITSVGRSQRDFIKMESRIVEYRDGVEVTDFVQFHSAAAVGDLLSIELNRAAEWVTNSMDSDLFKGKTEATAAWWGFVGLIGYADSSTYATLFGRTRSAANRLLDATLANTYVSTSEAISVSVVRQGYEKVLAHGSQLGDLIIVAHPTQVRILFDSEDAAIRNQQITMAGAPASFGFNRGMIPFLDGIPIVRDYYCESSAAAADMFAVVDLSAEKGLNLVVSKPLGARGLAKVGTSESAYVSFWGAAIYKSPRNVFVHTSLSTS